MAFSGGVYTLPTPALVPGQTVSSSENNTVRNDMAASFNLTFLRNGTSTATANLPMGGYKLTGLGVATTLGDALSYNQAAVVSNLTDTALTITRVPYVSTGGLLIDSASFTFDGTTLTAGGFSTSGNISAATASISGNITVSGGTANGVAYLNGSKVLTSGGALTFDGSNFVVNPTNTQFYVGSSFAKINNTAGASASFIMQDTSDSATIKNVGSSIVFINSASEGMRLTSTGLGIGTSSPNYRLQVKVNTDRNLGVGTSNNLADGITLSSVNDANGANKGLELRGTNMTLTAPGASSYINFRTGNSETEAMRIDSSGNLLVGTASNANAARLNIRPSGTIAIETKVVTNGDLACNFQNAAGTQVGYIQVTASATAYATSSDYRLKENIKPMQGALDVVAQLNPVTYTWKADGSDGQGFIAHELQAVVPDCVTGEKDAVDAEGKPVYQGIDTSFLVATLCKAIQELEARVKQLEGK